MTKNLLQYKGSDEHLPPIKGVSDPEGRKYYPYLPADADLIKAVNLAIALERPLLLEGEPGCGKTCLAGAIAYEFKRQHLGDKEWWPFYTWTIKSDSRAREGLYTFDAVARLRDAQLIASVGGDKKRLKDFYNPKEIEELIAKIKDPTRKGYRQFGPLGEALRQEWKEDHRPIVLIDEIDKADSDFANDLLLELEEWRFEIPETGEKFKSPEHKPIVLITSNRERPLPEPFLRRCLYYYVSFPEARLRDIIALRFGELKKGEEALVELAVERFYEIRELLENQPGGRAPGTSEFLLFLGALLSYPNQEAVIADLNQLANQLPLLGTLLKTQEAQELYRREFSKDDE
jgi:MoxR-like ATPase